MSMAPPGISTGRFYIILGYIPRKRTWQELKDFVYQAGFQVAHVQIHTGLHSGWISVDGEDNFWRLGEWLQQAEWDGNRFQVDMRNYDRETPLGPSSYIPLETPLSARSAYSLPSTASKSSSANINSIYDYSYKPTLQVATTQAYTYSTGSLGFSVSSPQQYSFGGLVSPTYSTSFVQPLSYSQAGIQQTNSTATYQYGRAPQVAIPSSSAPLQFTASVHCEPTPTPATVRVENRRLHLTRTTGASSEKEIRKRILAVCPQLAINPIENVEIPTHPDGRQKGHALVLLQTEELARRVRDRLDGTSFKTSDGRKHAIKVKFAQEGATEKRDELAVKIAGLSVGGDGEQMVEYGQSMNGNGGRNEAAVGQQLDEDPVYERQRRKSSLPVANGSNSVLPGAVGMSRSSAVGVESSSRETERRDAEKGRAEKHAHKDRERGTEKKHHSSSGGKGMGKNKRK